MKSIIVRFVVSLAVLVPCLHGLADTYVNNRGWYWPNNNPIPWGTYPQYWWNLTTGAAATVAPSLTDVVCLTNYPGYLQVFRAGTVGTAGSTSAGEIYGGPDKEILLAERSTSSSPDSYCAQTFTVVNPDGFSGFWSAGDSKAHIVLDPQQGHSPSLSHVVATNRMFLTVGTSASVESIQGGSAVDKKGAGLLRVKSVCGVDTGIFLQEGDLELDGVPARTTAPVAGALYHFDASRMDTMTYNVADGRTNVTAWASLGGTGMSAFVPPSLTATGSSRIHYANAPFISQAKSPTGLPLLDFGSATVAGVADYGPTNCTMALSRPDGASSVSEAGCATVREAFYAGVHTQVNGAPLFGGYSEYDWHTDGVPRRYSPSNAAKSVLLGEHTLNGAPANNAMGTVGRVWTDFHVYSCGATSSTARVRYLATDRLYPNKVGGWRVGEILLYTNALTRAERHQVVRYLMRKWMGADDADVGRLVVATADSAVGVREGGIANVRRLAAVSGSLEKTGGGRLEIDHISPDGLAVSVEAGSIALTPENSPVSASPAPAANPVLWLDAEHALTCTNAEGSSVRCVTKWADRRGEGFGGYAELPEGNAYWYGLPPYVKPGEANGHDLVSFYHDGNEDSRQSWMRIVPSGENACEAFIAQRIVNRSVKCSIFGSTTLKLYSGFWNVLDGGIGGQEVPGAVWTLNGAPFDPWTYRFASSLETDVKVYSVALPSKYAFDLLAKTRTNVAESQGRVDIGEFIIYDRRLTDAERRDTVAYLMEKWRGEKGPDAAERLRISSLSYSQGASPSLATGQDVVVNAVDGIAGRPFTKSGFGTMTVMGSHSGLAPSSITVEGGVLRFVMAPDPCGEALFHFDAADLSSLTCYVGDNGARTNVTAWSDTRANGIVSTSYISPANSSDAISFTNATLKTVETTAGVVRTVVDFGRRNSNNSTTKYDDAASMKISGVADKTVRELHVVWADANAEVEPGVFRRADMATAQNEYNYYRYGTMLIDSRPGSAAHCGAVVNGLIYADGEAITADFQPGTAAHLISAVPTNATTVTSMFLDRTSNAGGGWYGELVAFSNALTVTERDFLMKRLRAKWFGTAEPVWTNATPFSSITVAPGASLDLTKNAFVRADAISGGGSISAAGVMPGSLSLRYGGADDVERINVDGDVVFGGGATITVTADSADVVEPGEWTILSAASVSGPLPTLNAVNFGRKQTRLRFADGRIDLVVTKPGAVLIVR